MCLERNACPKAVIPCFSALGALPNLPANPNALPKGNDPLWQQQKGSHSNKAPLQNWQGTNFSAFPPDPSGAAGPNHYVHMVNSSYTIYDKTGKISNPTFGIGLRFSGYGFDFGYTYGETGHPLTNTMRFSLNMEF